jgi:2'-5' RNA ligase
MSHGATARLFVAVDPPAAAREELAAWGRAAAAGLELGGARLRLRLLVADLLHLTLCFLGSRPAGEISALGSALGACSCHVGELSVGAPLWLPKARPRSLAVGIRDDDGELSGAHATVTSAITETTGWKPERRHFKAHVTVARMRADLPSGRRLGYRDSPLPATPQLRFAPESMTLYRSWLSPEGATYEALATNPLHLRQ